MRPHRVLGLCLCAYLSPVIAAPAAPAALSLNAAEVDAVVAEWLADTGAPSVSIAIVQGDRIVYARAYGAASLAPSRAATASTRYAIDSLSKEFTAAALLLLAERGKLSLDDSVARWFPDLGAASAVSIRQLLSHTSGIRDYWPQDFLTPAMTRPATAASIVAEWTRRPLDFEPGTDWQYSNTGYVLAGLIVEKASGLSLFDFQNRDLFAPLHMQHVTQYSPPRGQSSTLGEDDARGYTRNGLAPAVRAPLEGAGWLFGAAHLAMQPAEMALWDISLMDRSLLSPASYEIEFAPIVLKNGHPENYAMGLEVATAQGRLRIGHSGGGSGFLADNRVWPKERVAIVVLTNNDWATPSDLSDRLAFMVLPATTEEARARSLFRAMQSGNVNRELFTAVGNFHMTRAAWADLRHSLGGFGPARLITLEHESRRGGMVTRRWKILCRNARLQAIERGYPGGKLDEFMVTKLAD